jgi:hypothetical protein
MAAILLVLPAVIALIAENTGHVKAVAEMTGKDLDPMMGRAIAGDGVGTTLASSSVARRPPRMPRTSASWPPPASTRQLPTGSPPWSQSSSASPRSSGPSSSSIPGGVLGGITVVLYGMIGLLGAKIWKENGVDFGNPINLVPVAAGIIIGIGDVQMKFTDNFSLGGISLGTIVAVGAYHLAKALAPADLRTRADGALIAVGDYTYGDSDGIDDLLQDDNPEDFYGRRPQG